jgi:hypothetical protein
MTDDTVAINVGQWTQTNAEFTDAAEESGRTTRWSGAYGTRRWRCLATSTDSTSWSSVRYGVRLGSPCAAGRPSRRRRPDSGATRDGAADAGGDGLEFPLVEAPGEAVPLADSSFDLVLSEYGASLWADPTNGFRRPHACSARAVGSSF